MLKATREKQKNSIWGIFSAETMKARREWHHIFKEMKGKTYNQEYTIQQGSLQIWWRNQMLYRQETTQRIQHQASFTRNAEGTSLDEKERPQLGTREL